MHRSLIDIIASGSMAACVVTALACTRTPTDRVLEPDNAPGAASSTPATPSTPSLEDASVAPGPIATTGEPATDFSVIRAPELGLTVDHSRPDPQAPGIGGSGAAGGCGRGAGGGVGGGIFR